MSRLIPPTCMGVDARWRVTGVFEEASGRRSCSLSGPNSYPLLHNSPSFQLLGFAEGLAHLHSSDIIHGDLKGVRVIIF